MAAEHNHFVSLVATANLTDRVVGSSALRINTIDDIKLENDFGAIIKDPADPAEVFIAHHHCRDYFVDVKCLVVESSYLSKLPACVVHSDCGAVRLEKSVKLLLDLTIRQRTWRVRGWSRSWRCLGKRERPRV